MNRNNYMVKKKYLKIIINTLEIQITYFSKILISKIHNFQIISIVKMQIILIQTNLECYINNLYN